MNEKYRIALVIIGIFAITLLSGCVGGEAAHDTLVIQIEEDILDIDNRHWSETSAYDKMFGFQWQGFLSMLAPGETIYYFPNAAENWTVNEDGTKYTYTLREGATFHDGSPIRARDVKYSFTANWYACYYDLYGMTNLSDLDEGALGWSDYLFNFSYPTGDPNGNGRVFTMDHGAWWPDQSYLFDAAGHWNLFMLIPEESSGKWTDTAEETAAAIEAFEANPISCGPYKFVEHKPQDYAMLERWDNWWGWGETFVDNAGNEWTFPSKDQAFKYVKFRPIPEPAMALVELRTGGIDLTTSRFDSLTALESTKEAEGYDAISIDVLGGASLEPNTEGDRPTFFGGMGNYPISEDWFRKAVSHAIDRENIVDNIYGGIAGVREVVYPDWILDKFPNLDVSDYYDFGTNPDTAEQILNASGYLPLGFSNEPGNRFGYGPYKNETKFNDVEQSRGHHFLITTMSTSAWTVNRALAVQKDLREVGIYVDVELLEWGSYIDALYDVIPGDDYNRSFTPITETVFDEEWHGPDWDFTLGGFGYYYETPQQYMIYMGSYHWFWDYGGTPSVFNEDFEREYAKIVGGNGYMSDFGISEDVYPYPEWSADDDRYVEACEEAGRLMSHMLSTIPIVWYQDTYAYDSHLKNLLADRASNFNCAYAYWE